MSLPLAVLVLAAPAGAAAKEPEDAAEEAGQRATAPVKLDGSVLFWVRGVSAYPAEKRAALIESHLEAAARDPEVKADGLRVEEFEDMAQIMAGDQLIANIYDADAKLEEVRRSVLARVVTRRIRDAIGEYRLARHPDVLLHDGIYAVAATVGLALSLVLILWLSRRLDAEMERRLHRHIHALDIQSFQIVRAERLWAALRGALSTGRGLVILTAALTYLYVILDLFPWTRDLAWHLQSAVVGPLASIAHGIVSDIPDLAFLAILVAITRYVLKVMRFFFDGVERGSITISGFQAQWAEPTYRILRIAIVAFTLVVAYPYIPGSGSAAFKGVSLFLGVVFSLGSSSVIANTIAGYALIYRRAFTVGDRVKINDMVGDVTEMRLQVTHLRSLKNEELIVPNSLILGSQVVNYSSLARSFGLILHTTLGIGYEVPWRQVEAMLLLAAGRTAGLLREPPPFVLHQSLGDFAINYELNVYCDDAQAMMALYTELHRNILDVFNEYGVQIMTPAYEHDPEQPKVVPKGQWYTVPAHVEAG